MEVHFCPDEKHRLAAGGRGQHASRTVTFDSASLTIMLSITPGGHDLIRLDGWLAPAGRHEVELRSSGGPRATTADHEGRFVIDDVPHGLAQLVIRPNFGPDGTTRAGRAAPVVTPAIVV